MKQLMVLYDASCGFCVRCRAWMEAQPKFLELEFVPAGSAEARRRFPALDGRPIEELTVIDDEGGVYSGPSAFILCLYALHDYRAWSERLAHPAWMPLAKVVFDGLSSGRKRISKWLDYFSIA